MENGNVFRAQMFIDCTYEGDLMAKAGVPYMVGREANERFGETLNGNPRGNAEASVSRAGRSLREAGRSHFGIVAVCAEHAGRNAGRGDRSVQAYNFRLCLTKNPANRKPIEPPPGYDAKRYELLGRYFIALARAEKKVTLANFLNINMVTRRRPTSITTAASRRTSSG
jgi:hypothetical protein